ncbi:MAG: DUF3105 domain-containing protein [Geodermatophilaceae bacterium]
MHSLEHGAVWVAYRSDLPAADVAALAVLVDGVDYTMMSPTEICEGSVRAVVVSPTRGRFGR